MNNLAEATEVINHYKEIIKTQHKRVIQYTYKQGEIIKIFKETKNFFDNMGQSKSTVYFKTAVYKHLKKTLVSTSQHYPQVTFKITWKLLSQSAKTIPVCFLNK